MARRWRKRIEKSRYDAESVGDRYIEIRYEDLVTDTEPTLRRVCELIEIDFDPQMLDYHERAEERLQEMARDLPAGQGRPHRPGEERLQAHALLTEPPNKERVATWKEEMRPRGRRRVRGGRGPSARGARLRDHVRGNPSAILRSMRLPSLRRRDDAGGRPPAPFVVGANRSGTTLLRMMLDAHPLLTIPPETHFVPDVIDAADEGATPERIVEVMTSHREWGDFDLDSDEVLERLRRDRPADRGRARCAPSTASTPSAPARSAGARRRRAMRPTWSRSRAPCPRPTSCT